MNKRRSSPTWIVPLLLFLGLIGRASFLEYTDLIDPTESRYAVVAQEMIHSDNWLTPHLPMPEGMIPYLGKPPLHFWLTALSYKFFGFEEWTARLPSVFATLAILATLILFTRRFESSRLTVHRAVGFDAALVYLSSAMGFFLCGASVTDVTLSACITAGVASLYAEIRRERDTHIFGYIAAISAALGFLTKGPISIALIGLPVALWSIGRRDFAWIRSFPWVRAVCLFFLVTAPWFVLSEIANPGFLKYFFWNENVARYLFKNYGDRYGSGHTHLYGTSWAITLGAFLPWSIPLLGAFYYSVRDRCADIKSDPHLFFLWCWSLSTPLFFTFVKQLHGMYLLPALPPLSLLLTHSFRTELGNSRLLHRLGSPKLNRYLLFLIAGLIIIISDLVTANHLASSFALTILLIGASLVATLSKRSLRNIRFSSTSGSVLVLYCVAIAAATPIINSARSAEVALRTLADSSNCRSSSEVEAVGISTDNSFSHYWTAAAGRNELSRPLSVNYISTEQAVTGDICFYMYNAKSSDKVPATISTAFNLIGQSGNWFLYARKARA